MERRQLSRFFTLTFAFTWAVWIPLAITRPPLGIAMPFVVLGAFGPSLMGVWLTARHADAPARRDFWLRVRDWRRIPGGWWAFILLLFPVLAAASALINRWAGGDPVSLDTVTLTNPGRLAGFIVGMILAGPLAEELGWRGYALDRLQALLSPLAASLGLGLIWAAWHLPLFLMPETSQGAMGLWSVPFWLWTAQVVSYSIIYTWVFNHTGRSILSAFMLHFMGNTTFTLMAGLGGRLPLSFMVATTVAHVGVAAAIGWRLRGRRAATPAGGGLSGDRSVPAAVGPDRD